MKDIRVLEKRRNIGDLRRSVEAYEDIKRGVVSEDVHVYIDILNGTALYPVPRGFLYTAVFGKNKELLPTHPFSQATQYFIDKYGYPEGMKMFVFLNVPPPERDRIISNIDRKWREREHK